MSKEKRKRRNKKKKRKGGGEEGGERRKTGGDGQATIFARLRFITEVFVFSLWSLFFICCSSNG